MCLSAGAQRRSATASLRNNWKRTSPRFWTWLACLTNRMLFEFRRVSQICYWVLRQTWLLFDGFQ
jgi:hypothetical protein